MIDDTTIIYELSDQAGTSGSTSRIPESVRRMPPGRKENGKNIINLLSIYRSIFPDYAEDFKKGEIIY